MSEPEPNVVFVQSKEDTYLAFADAVDAWSGVEAAMRMLFTGLNTPGDFSKSSMILNAIIGTRAQLDVMRAAAFADLHLMQNPGLMKEVNRVLEKISDNATIRNRIIHGNWRISYDHKDGTAYARLERVFTTKDTMAGLSPATEDERKEALGKFIFGKAELESAAEKFRITAERAQKAHEAITLSGLRRQREKPSRQSS